MTTPSLLTRLIKGVLLTGLTLSTLWLSGCATDQQTLKAPCPNFGATCSQKNINSWYTRN